MSGQHSPRRSSPQPTFNTIKSALTFPSHVKKESEISYSTFRGVITKHHLVQIAPVAISATFCVSESDSAGLARSLMPARTRHHYIRSSTRILAFVSGVISSTDLHHRCPIFKSASLNRNKRQKSLTKSEPSLRQQGCSTTSRPNSAPMQVLLSSHQWSDIDAQLFSAMMVERF